jgi:alpha-N-acetylglucosamine transferase
MQKLITKKMATIVTSVVLLMAVVAVAMPKAEAASGIVYMKIYNSKTNIEKVVVWEPSAYRFEKKVFIDADDVKVNKVHKIFNTTELKVRNTILPFPQTATWHHFVVTIGSDTYKQVKFM